MRAVSKFAFVILSAAALALASQTASAQAPEKRKVNIATASLGLPYLPLIIAQQRKYFADEGLEVEIAAFAGGSKALQSLMGGSSDVASGAYSNTLTMAAKGHAPSEVVSSIAAYATTLEVSMPPWLTEAHVARVQERLRHLRGLWRSTKYGGSMELGWDRAKRW